MEVTSFGFTFDEFFKKLDQQTVIKVTHTISLLAEFGHELSMPHSKMVARGLFELRLSGESAVRLLYTFHNNQAFVVHAFTKKSEKLPKQDLEIALKRMRFLDVI